MRNGVPLPGLTPPQVVSQLTYRVFGPLHPYRVRIVLDYHGIIGQPAGTIAEIAARHQVSSVTVHNYVRAVRGAGTELPLTSALIIAATSRSQPTDDHLGRVRIARTLGLPAPEPPPIPAAVDTVPAAHHAAARAALRVLAAAGPLDTDALLAAVTRSRRFLHRTPLTAADLAAALQAAGATAGPDGQWQPPAGYPVPDRYRAIVTTAAGRDLTRTDMIGVLLDAGYSRNSSTGRMSSSHPLFHRIGPNRYRVIGTASPRV